MIKNGELLDQVFKLYESRKSHAEHLAFENNQKALQNPEYSSLHYAIKNLNMDIAKADYDGDAVALEQLKIKRDALRKDRDALLNSLGFAPEDLKAKYHCANCKDSGYLQDGTLCSCFFETLSEVSERLLGIDPQKLPSFDDFNDDNEKLAKLKQKFLQYCDKFPPQKIKNLIFCGATGTGKTFTAGAIANQLKEKNFNVIFLSATKLNEIFRLYHMTDLRNQRAIFDLLCNCDLLVIDDLGTEPIFKNVTVVYLTSFISERLANEKPFIITTNLSLDEIKDRYNERLLSRLSGDSTLRIAFDGDDLRLKK